MGEVISLDGKKLERGPHKEGEAYCLACGHGWVAVAPLDHGNLECPKCGGMHGWFRYPVLHPGELHLFCLCGYDIFRVTPNFTYCADCGKKVNKELLQGDSE